MNRRNALKYTAAIMGSSIIGAEAFLSACSREPLSRGGWFTAAEIQLLDEIGETILPESNRSPGAKAAQIGTFMEIMHQDCYTAEEQTIFRKGIEIVDQASRERYQRPFLKLSAEERLALLSEFDQAARTQSEPVHFFTLMKQLTILGYFSSEVGVTQALRYDPIPGHYRACIDYQEGDRAWYGPLSSIG
jgi:hypothetical protein